jgi:hypothetical protein
MCLKVGTVAFAQAQ